MGTRHSFIHTLSKPFHRFLVKQPTFWEACLAYREECRARPGPSDATHTRRDYTLGILQRARWADKALDRIGEKEITRYLRSLDISDSTIYRYLTEVAAIYRCAIKHGLTERSPITDLRRWRKP